MKTKLLFLFLCLAGFELRAQIPAAPRTNVNRNEQLMRDALQRGSAAAQAPAGTVVAPQQIVQGTPGNIAVDNAAALPAATAPVAAALANPTPDTDTQPQAGPGTRILSLGSGKPPVEQPGMDDLIESKNIRFVGADFDTVLDIYARYVNRTILRSPTLPVGTLKITLNVVQTSLTKREVIQLLDAIFAMNNIITIPVGEKFMKVVPSAEGNGAAQPAGTADGDQLPELGSYITYVVQLQYARPTEVLPAITPFARLPTSVLAIDSSGILVLRDYTENVKRMLEMIKHIDVAIPAEIVSEVIPIKYALAGDIASALNSVGGTTAATVGGGSATGAARTGSTLGNRPQTAGYSPSVGGAAANTRLGTAAGGINAPAGIGGAAAAGGAQTDFTSRIRAIINRASTPGGGGGAGEFTILGQTKIIPDERTNSLLVFATRQDMDMIKSIVAKLDVVLAQVLIEAVILDVTLGDDMTLGLSAGQAPLSSGNATGGGAFNNTGGTSLSSAYGFLNNLIPSMVTNITALTTNISTIFSQNPNANFPGGNGLTYFGQIGPTWTVALQALANNSKVKVLARPSIQTSHAVPANIFVGETRPYISGTSFDYNGSGSHSQYQQSQIGISLDVIPLINVDGLVVMDIQQQVQQASAKGAGVLIDGNEVPITKEEHASAKVAVHSGETIVMGGFIQSEKAEGKSGIPFLQDIPMLGALFRTTSKSQARRELLVLIRPTVLPTPEIAAANTEVERNRHPADKMAERIFQNEEKKLLKEADYEDSLNKETKVQKQKRLFGHDTPVIEIP